MGRSIASMKLWVVIPCYNEAAGIRPTLEALRTQTDRDFSLVIVDNASTDGTREVIEAYAKQHPGFDVRVIHETQKGTGAASDSGCRYAIDQGATHIARTDGDCLPRKDWVANVKRAFADGVDFVAGRIGHRTDDFQISLRDRAVIEFMTQVMAAVSPHLPHNRSPEFVGPYVMASGGNLALTADIYLRSGGFPRTKLEEDNEDRALQNRVRKITDKIQRRRDVVVYQSTRRVKHYGFKNTLLWYWNRKYKPETVDVR